MPGVGVRDGEAEVALDPGQGGVAYPVGADLLGLDPRQVLADACPQAVVAPVGDRLPVAVAQQLYLNRKMPMPVPAKALKKKN